MLDFFLGNFFAEFAFGLIDLKILFDEQLEKGECPIKK